MKIEHGRSFFVPYGFLYFGNFDPDIVMFSILELANGSQSKTKPKNDKMAVSWPDMRYL